MQFFIVAGVCQTLCLGDSGAASSRRTASVEGSWSELLLFTHVMALPFMHGMALLMMAPFQDSDFAVIASYGEDPGWDGMVLLPSPPVKSTKRGKRALSLEPLSAAHSVSKNLGKQRVAYVERKGKKSSINAKQCGLKEFFMSSAPTSVGTCQVIEID